ncbi:glycoside hydrolase family 5 protein [Piloderma croceum F 1598]|uniref:mannan endo-1,4-beta-mannosidase n=1 Tax=Piloderma croceum (strain F 1598) TaxID=765440 RepID=A0A0C3FGN8_PILCF|nr:glycoside hydrolase family 5 protein [Piloderma croceum F 1598]
MEQKRWNSTGFVSVKDADFQLNGVPYRFYGTNAYWVQMLTDEDIETTFHDIATADYRVVRTWAFNDVANKPSSGTYFQILQNGKATINDGADGLQRLDQVVATANKFGVKLLLTLTNNWDPKRTESSSSFRRWDDGTLPRGYLSNDYGGMDLYNRAFVSNPTHDDFYTNPDIINAFKNYISHVVKRYANNSAVLGWELANDPRCSSTLQGSSSCNTKTITTWVNDISGYIKNLDSNHLITAGDGGFYCEHCPKLYAKTSTKPPTVSVGSTFDGSFGVDTEDILSVPCIDFGSFQLFPDQNQYFPGSSGDFASTAISQGNRWVAQHSATSSTFKKPMAITAFSIVTKDNWPLFVPFNSSTRMPPGAPCRGVDNFQKNYAFVSWAEVGLTGSIGGALEYQWGQKGLEDVPHVNRKRQATGNTSPDDGNANYQNSYTGQTATQFASSLSM